MTGNDERLLEACLGEADEPGVLARAALIAACHAHPDLNIERYLAQLDQDAAQILARKPADAPRTWVINQLNHFLFEERGFRGNQEDYYDPRNSLLNQVIDRRMGIPITLCICISNWGGVLVCPLKASHSRGIFW